MLRILEKELLPPAGLPHEHLVEWNGNKVVWYLWGGGGGGRP